MQLMLRNSNFRKNRYIQYLQESLNFKYRARIKREVNLEYVGSTSVLELNNSVELNNKKYAIINTESKSF